jgi:hypothetical protein
MRRKQKFKFESNMFGTEVSLLTKQGPVLLATGLDRDWSSNQTALAKDYYWFRSPKISVQDLSQTVQGLVTVQGMFDLEVWMNSQQQMDASLKIVDSEDAAEWAWTWTNIWQKWDNALEEEWAQNQNQKPPTVKINDDGSATVNVTVDSLEP